MLSHPGADALRQQHLQQVRQDIGQDAEAEGAEEADFRTVEATGPARREIGQPQAAGALAKPRTSALKTGLEIAR